MCECGCTMNNKAFRLPVDGRTAYVIELYPGCKECTAGPGILVRKVSADTEDEWDWDELMALPELPFRTIDNLVECPIAVGLDPDAFVKAASPVIDGYSLGKRTTLDGDDAYEIAGEVWGAAVRRMPTVGSR